ncbi:MULTISPECIES: hypothetical protein [Paraburkholderia]|uniref:Uncharacterized protein n=2 Tax=Paraburkholderia TaxID=1822464 RepID=A0A7Y9WDR4_9BURK|nr:hypothetical protein [Paraburkholderia bryophila]NYH18985.1 hypothetical protein [Paraburkholderia bryophila]
MPNKAESEEKDEEKREAKTKGGSKKNRRDDPPVRIKTIGCHPARGIGRSADQPAKTTIRNRAIRKTE